MCGILVLLGIALALPWHPSCKVAAPSRWFDLYAFLDFLLHPLFQQLEAGNMLHTCMLINSTRPECPILSIPMSLSDPGSPSNVTRFSQSYRKHGCLVCLWPTTISGLNSVSKQSREIICMASYIMYSSYCNTSVASEEWNYRGESTASGIWTPMRGLTYRANLSRRPEGHKERTTTEVSRRCWGEKHSE